jgi:hypothetical protein
MRDKVWAQKKKSKSGKKAETEGRGGRRQEGRKIYEKHTICHLELPVLVTLGLFANDQLSFVKLEISMVNVKTINRFSNQGKCWQPRLALSTTCKPGLPRAF